MKNKVALITGASRGIGKEIALSLAGQGVNLVLIGRAEKDLKILQEEIASFNVKSEIYAVNVSDEKAVRSVIEKVIKTFQKIDFVINNAGVGTFMDFEKISEVDWDAMMDTNVKGTFLITKHIVPILKAQKSGHILTIASDVSKRTFPTGSVYCASKYAQDALMSTVRMEMRPFGVKVSTIYPGLVDTYFGDTKKGEAHKKAWLKTEDIANAVVYVLNTPKHVVIDELMIHPISQDY
jgi:NADP-dependent 3-hydroxy acid dehydrogenase YdfG